MTPHIRTSGHLVEITDGRSMKQFRADPPKRVYCLNSRCVEPRCRFYHGEDDCQHGVHLDNFCAQCAEKSLPI